MKDIDAYRELREIQRTPALVAELEKKVSQLETIHHNLVCRISALEAQLNTTPEVRE